MNSVFNLYGKYYDLLYRDKDYLGESEYISNLIEKFRPDAKSILDLGCGTGRHDIIFADKGYDVTGVEISGSMYEEAEYNKKNVRSDRKLKFLQNDFRELQINEKFDIIVSLFHVMSYQTSNKDLLKTFTAVDKHLKEDGIFMFDFWYGPGVLNDRPETRTKHLEDDEIKVKRFAEPFLKINENIVDVRYTVSVEDKLTGNKDEFSETHSMRYFFIPELKLILNFFNMGIIHYEEWMTGEKLSDKSWSAFVLAGKKS